MATKSPHKNSQWSRIAITFDSSDLKLRDNAHIDTMVIKTNITEWIVTKILVDTGSSTDIIFASTFDKLSLIETFSKHPGTLYTASVERKCMALEKYPTLYPSKVTKTIE